MEVRCLGVSSGGLIDERGIVVSCVRTKSTVVKLGRAVLSKGFVKLAAFPWPVMETPSTVSKVRESEDRVRASDTTTREMLDESLLPGRLTDAGGWGLGIGERRGSP
jgi:hypothetical protein